MALLSDLINKVKKRKDEVLADISRRATNPFPKTVYVEPNSFTGKLAQGVSNLGAWRNVLESNQLKEIPQAFRNPLPKTNTDYAKNALADIASGGIKMFQGGYDITSGLGVGQRMSGQPTTTDKMRVARGGLNITESAPYYAGGKNLKAALGYMGFSGVLGGAGNYLQTKDKNKALDVGVKTGLEFAPKALTMAGVTKLTGPLIDKVGSKLPFYTRLPIKSSLNVGEGVMMDRFSDMPTTKESVLIDALFPVAGELLSKAFKSAGEAMRITEAKVLTAFGKKLRNNKGAYTTAKKFVNKTRAYNKTGKYAAGSFLGFEPYQDEQGNWKVRFDEKKALAGLLLTGGFTKSVKSGTAEDLMKSIKRSSLAKKYGDDAKELSRVQDKFGMKNYKNNMAELEARTVSNRADLPDNQRYTSDPYYQTMQSEGLKPSDIIVNKGNGVSANQNPLYRGTTKAEIDNLLSGKKLVTQSQTNVYGEQIPSNRTFLTDKRELAEHYAKTDYVTGKPKPDGYVIEFKPSVKDKSVTSISKEAGSSVIQQSPNEYYAKDVDINDVSRILDSNGKVIYQSKGNGVSASQDLINEARKYKSAEEFVEAQQVPVDLEIKNLKSFTGVPFEYAGISKEGRIAVDKYKNLKELEPIKISPAGVVEDGHHRVLSAIEKGQTTIKGRIDLTKSQLTDIYNQSNKPQMTAFISPSETLSQRASELVQPQPQQKIRLKASTPQKVSIPLQSEESLGNRMVRPEASSETILPQNDIKLLPQRIVRNGEVVGDGFTIENYKHPLSRKQGEIKTQSILRQQTANEVRLAKESAERVAKTVSKVIEENTQGAIKREVTATEKEIANSANWKDKAKLAYGRETMSRNFDDIMGKDAPKMKSVYLDPVGKSEADRVRFLNKEKADFKSLGIKAYSKESKLLQLYGEGKIGLEELKTKTKDWKKVVDANTTFRQKYDDYLTKINAILIKNGYDAIPRRKDYFLHFQEIGSVLEQFGIPAKVDALPTDINGLTADFKPGKTFFSSALPRLGDKTKFDAVEGIERYLDGASKQIYHTDNIQRLRGLEKALREAHAGTNKLSNFVADLTEYTNTLAGKKSMLDRGLEAAVGRGVYTASNKLRRQVGANMVGGNVSSALTNFIPLTQAMATTSKPSFIRGMLDTISTTIRDDGFTSKSDFLTRRFGDDRLALSLFDKVADKAGWLFKTIDRFTAETIVRSKYYEGLKKGLGDTEALKRADEWAMKVMADRSIGQQPTLFNSKTMGFLTQFELEVNNQLSFIFKDLPRNYKGAGLASAMGQVFLYSYLFNSLFESATGRRPAFDPIGVAVQAYEDYTNENMKKGQATKNLVGNATAQLPFVGIVTEGGRIPVSSALPDVKGLVEGTTNWKKEGLKIASNLLLPTGGGQIRKTIEGTKAYNQGASITDKGRVRYPIQQTPANRIRTSLFGQYSTPEARSYFREGRSVLGEKQSEFFRNANPEQKQNIYEQIINNRNNNKKQTSDTEGRVFAMESGGNYVIKDDKLTYLKENGDLDSIDLNFKVPTPKQTGNTELDKKRRSAYYGDITAKINDIVKLNELGVLTDEEAEALIIDLQAQKEAFQGKSGGGNGTTKKIKIASPPKLSSIKLATPKTVKLDILKNTSSGQRIKLPQMRPPTPQSPKKTVSVKSLAKAFEKYK